jgi:hypothetical protein
MFFQKHGFVVMWLFIVFVSVHDGYLVVANRAVMQVAEQNPAGRWLIQRNAGDVWLLLAVKAAGTLAVASILLVLHWLRPAVAQFACAVVASFQAGLLAYLYLS